MPEAKWDRTLACEDYNVLGKVCPFARYSWRDQKYLCSFFGKDIDVPENGVCDKHPGMLVLSRLAVITGTMDPGTVRALTESKEYRDWEISYNYYQNWDPKKEEEILRTWLHNKASRYGGSKREFKRRFRKLFKPEGVGLSSDSDPSFRMRVLDGSKEIRKSYPYTEYVALYPTYFHDSYEEGGEMYEEDYWDLGVLTLDTAFEFLLDELGTEQFTSAGLFNILEAHEGRKILIKWSWSSASYHEGDYDIWINSIEYVRDLPESSKERAGIVGTKILTVLSM